MNKFYFHPFNWTCKDLNTGFFFFVEGHDQNNKTCLVRIKYNPWMYVMIEDGSTNTAKQLEVYLKSNVFNGTIVDVQYERRKETYFYDSPERLLMKVFFNKMKNLKYVVKLLSTAVDVGTGPRMFHVFEDKDDPILKYHFERNLGHTGWHYVDNPKFITGDDMLSEFQKELYVSNSNSVSIETNQDKIRTLGIPKPTILSFDIECVSDSNKFPTPEYIEDSMFMIACSFLDRDDKITRYNIIMGKSIKRDDVEIIEVENEGLKKECVLCNKFSNLVRELDPDILIGHNVFKFDWYYMNKRNSISTNGKYIPYMGRYKNWKMEELGEDTRLTQGAYQEAEWESSAYADQKIGYILTPGRIQMDLLPIVQRLGYKLDSYKLEFISQFFLGEGKTGLEPKEMFHLYKLSKECNRLLKNNKKEECSKSEFKEIQELDLTSNWRQKIEDLEIKSMFEIDKYCVQDTMLPIRIAQKINLWICLVEDSKIVHVNIIDLYTRGQGVRVYNQEYMELKSQGYFIKKIKVQKRNYKGAFVFSAIVGYYKKVHCLDFAKLYPSIMIAYNICYTTFVQEDMFNPNPNIKDEDCNVFEWDEDEDDTDTDEENQSKKIKYRFRFVKPHIRKGILPTILERLADARDDAKLQLKKEKDQLMKIVLDKRQNNIKISMNSIYGNKGTNMAKLPLYEAAMCTTAKGRQLIHQTADFIEKKYGAKVVYGDTDSVMFTMPLLDNGMFEKYIQPMIDDYEKMNIPSMMRIVAKKVSELFPSPVCMEYEKTFRDYLLVGKKMYTGMLANEKDLDLYDEKKLFFRGLPVVRRDNCKFLRETLKNVAIQIFKGNTEDDVFEYVLDQAEKLIQGKVEKEELFIYKKIGKEDGYKSKTADMALFIKYLKSKGEEPSAGDRYEYLLAKIDTKYKGEKYRTITHLQEEGLEIDYFLYLESNFVKPIQKILHRWNPKKFSSKILTILLKFIEITGSENVKNRFLELFKSDGDILEKVKQLKSK